MSTNKLISDRLVVGLTGGIGSGKTIVADGLAKRGASIVDTDVIARELTAMNGAAIDAIRFAFGDDMIAANGAMDRAKMRALIFSDVKKKAQLESILHPMIYAEVARQVSSATGLYVVVVIPLLVETGRWSLSNLDRILVVDCDEEIQIQRVMKRDGYSAELVKTIMAQQASRAQRLAMATEIIGNQTNIEALNAEIDRLHQTYCRLAN